MSAMEHDEFRHVPVLADEIVRLLSPQNGEIWVDATVGHAGHARLLLGCIGSEGRLICVDQDESMLRFAKQKLSGNAHFWHASFERLPVILEEMKLTAVDGVLADLGVCSEHLDDPGRGFSFLRDGPLDMRMNVDEGEPASQLVKRLKEKELADLFWQYGEERFSRRIARRIVESRKKTPIETTGQLADLVRGCVPRPKKRKGAIDPATRVFQALRIAVNRELDALKHLLNILPSCIRPGGCAGVISFHSLEDRLVKHAFRNRGIWENLTKKPVQPGLEEQNNNPRSRSAKLRVAKRTDNISESGSEETAQ